MGLVHVYTGDGKGKTSAALGLVLRALGWGKKIAVIQFIKGYSEIGEMKFAQNCINMDFVQISHTEKLSISEKDVTDRKKDAEKALETAREMIFSGIYDLAVLDEICGAIHYNLVERDDVLKIISGRPEKTELVLTGSFADKKIIETADYVTEMKKIKHPYDKGVMARKGVDY